VTHAHRRPDYHRRATGPPRQAVDGELDTAPEFDITNVVILPRQALEAERGWTNIEGYDIWVLPTLA
jgi:hypothetical protein